MKHYVDLEGDVRCQDCNELSQDCKCDDCQNCVLLQAKLDKALAMLSRCLEWYDRCGTMPPYKDIEKLIQKLETVEE